MTDASNLVGRLRDALPALLDCAEALAELEAHIRPHGHATYDAATAAERARAALAALANAAGNV